MGLIPADFIFIISRVYLSIFKLNVYSELFLPSAMPFRHLPCHSAICHVIPPSAMSFRHPPCHSTIRHRSNFSIPLRWQAQHNAFDQPPHLIPPSATSFHHLPPHSAICQPIPPSATPFRHPPPHSAIRHPIPVTGLQGQF
jgi:hypothetical protein